MDRYLSVTEFCSAFSTALAGTAQPTSPRAELAMVREERVAALEKLGALFTDRVKDPDRAMETWRELLAIDPAHAGARTALTGLYLDHRRWDDLEELYGALGQYEALVSVLEQHARTADKRHKVLLYRRIALLYRDRLTQPDRAVSFLEQVIYLDSQNLEAAEALVPLYEAARDHTRLLRVLPILIAHAKDAAAYSVLLRHLADVRELARSGAAAPALPAQPAPAAVTPTAVADLRPEGPPASFIEQIKSYISALPRNPVPTGPASLAGRAVQEIRRLGTPHDALQSIVRLVDALKDDTARAAGLLKLGEVCEDLFLRQDLALRHYQQSFKLDRGQLHALSRSRAVYGDMGNLDMATKLLELELELETDRARRPVLERLLGESLLDTRQRDRALPHLEAASRKWHDTELTSALAACRYDRGGWRAEVERLLRKAADPQATGRIMAAQLYLRAARILHIEVPTDPKLEECLRQLLALDPQNKVAVYLLEKMYGDQGLFDEIVRLHQQQVEHAASREQMIEIWKHQGAMWLVRWPEKNWACHCYGRALEAAYRGERSVEQVFPGHLAAFDLLRDVRGAAGEWEHVLAYADMACTANMSHAHRAALMTQATRVAWRDAGMPTRAGPYLEWLHHLDPHNAEIQAFVDRFGASGTS